MFVNKFFFVRNFPQNCILLEFLSFIGKKSLTAHREMVRDKIYAGDMQY